MSERTTRRQVETAFTRFVNAIGGRQSSGNTDVGAYALDWRSSPHRRVNVIRYGPGGAEHEPFGPRLRTYEEMWHALDMAATAAQLVNGNPNGTLQDRLTHATNHLGAFIVAGLGSEIARRSIGGHLQRAAALLAEPRPWPETHSAQARQSLDAADEWFTIYEHDEPEQAVS